MRLPKLIPEPISAFTYPCQGGWIEARGTPACPSSWPGATGADSPDSIGYSDYYTDSDGESWFIIRSTDSNGYTIIRAYAANGDSSAYTTNSADQVCYLMVRRPGDTQDVAEPQQIIFPSDNDDGDDAASGSGAGVGGFGGGANPPTPTATPAATATPTPAATATPTPAASPTPTPAATPSPRLAASNMTATTATLTITNHVGDWHYRYTSPSGGTCSEAVSGNTATVSGLTPGASYTFAAYSDSECTTEIAAMGAMAMASPTLAASNVGQTTATLTLSGWDIGKDGSWRYKHSGGACSSGQNSATASLSGLYSGTSYTFAAYSDSGCTTEIATAATFTTDSYVYVPPAPVPTQSPTPTPPPSTSPGQSSEATLSAGMAPTATTNTLTITKHTGNWWYKSANTSCVSAGSAPNPNTTGHKVVVTGLDKNMQYIFEAYSDSVCTTANKLATAAAFTTTNPSLAASSIIHNSATLTLSGWDTDSNKDGSWYYKSTTTGATTCSSAQSSGTASLSGLTASTSYTYTAYSDNGCSTVIARASQFTTLAAPIVSNLSQPDNREFGVSVPHTTRWATAFTTGSSGYTLSKIAVKFGARSGNISVRIHNNSNGLSGTIADHPGVIKATLSGPSNPGDEIAIYECSGDCGLAASAANSPSTYHLVLESSGNSGQHQWRGTNSDGETSSGGVSIGNSSGRRIGSGPWNPTASQDSGLFAVYATATATPSLTATSSYGQINLTRSDFTGDWWFRVGGHGCTSAGSGDTVEGIGGYSGTQTIRAYSDNACGTEVASDTVTVQKSTLTATVDNDKKVALTLSDGPNNWWFRIGAHSCTEATGDRYPTTGGIGGYTGGPHTVKAYLKTGCSVEIASTTFTIP